MTAELNITQSQYQKHVWFHVTVFWTTSLENVLLCLDCGLSVHTHIAWISLAKAVCLKGVPDPPTQPRHID